MINRRRFLGCLTAAASSYVLVACGGGSNSDATAPGSNSSAAKANASVSTSPNGTTTPPAASIVDASGIVWTTSNGYIYRNGTKDPYSYNVTMLLWYNGSVFQQNTSGDYYVWLGTGWTNSVDPRLIAANGTTSASGTTTPPASAIVDASGSVWMTANGYIYRNGTKDPYSYNVVMLLWYNGSVYQQNTSGDFYQWIGSGWTPASNPCLGGTSANGTTTPPAASIVDASGIVWMTSNGYIYRNGIKDPYSYNVALLLWYNGSVYQQNTGGDFYKWLGTGWTPSVDPRVGGNISANGTTTPPATSIIDASGIVWTTSNGYIYRNGTKDPYSYNVTMLLWYNGSVYQENTSGNFYQWLGSGWTSCIDPRLGGTSADGTTIPSAAYIIDKSSNIWTLSNGYIYKNKVKDPSSSNVSLLLWYGGMIYQSGTGGQFSVLTWNGNWLPCTDPRIAAAATPGAFYGINGHYDYTFTPAQVVGALRALGCTTYRVGVFNTPTQINALVALASAFKSAGLTLFPLVEYGLRDTNNNLYTSESAAYQASFSGAAAIATALAPYGVTMYECGNELTRDGAIILNSATAGTGRGDFNNANWPIMRGAMRGMIDGIKSVQPNAKCGINFCVADIAASDMLWDGLQPNGTSGYPKVRWDITTWHNYQPYGDIFDVGSDGAGPGFNLPIYCKARYGVPFIISEWNAAPEDTEAFRATYVSQQLGEFYAARKTSAVQSVMYYDLTSGDQTFGIVSNTLVPIQPTYGAFQSFVAANPDT
ncbi:hypothetical protein [Paraburkholderia sp. BR13444]|uniref:hypothetical protein n=1 Tax=Paraburkholderia TaxID=1822464 RepID=UPI0034CF8D79